MEELAKETYHLAQTSCRQINSLREANIMKRIDVEQRLYDLKDSKQAEDSEDMDAIDSVGKGIFP